MNFFTKNRVEFWLLIFLIVIVVSAIITFILFYADKPTIASQQIPANTGNRFRKELVLSPVQSKKVATILAEYRKLTEPIAEDIKDHRIQILDELAKSKPDTNILNNYMEEITSLQKQMQKASVSQYMALKEICTPVQCQRLSALYLELYGCDQMRKGSGKGQGQGNGKMRRYRGGR